MTGDARPSQWTAFARGAFTLICCTAGGASVVMPDSGLSGSVSASSPVPFLAGGLLAAVSASAFWRGVQGQSSATWAVLAFGSWMVFLATMSAHVAWQARDILFKDWSSLFIVVLAAALLLLARGGLREAWHGEWDRMGRWVFGTLVLLFFLFPQHLYASHFADMRGKSTRSVPDR